MLRFFACALVASSLLFLTSCQTETGDNGKPTTAAMGQPLSSPMSDQLSGTLVDDDKKHAGAAEQLAYTGPIGQQLSWNNPQTGDSGTITPIRDGYAENGGYCREFRLTTTTGGALKEGHSRACQQSDGTWKLVP